MGTERGAVTKAAQELGITKQALSLYLLEKATPGSEALRRICSIWNLELNVGGALVSAEKSEKTTAPDPEQLSLFHAISQIADEEIGVTVMRRRDQSLDLKVTINFDKVRRD